MPNAYYWKMDGKKSFYLDKWEFGNESQSRLGLEINFFVRCIRKYWHFDVQFMLD